MIKFYQNSIINKLRRKEVSTYKPTDLWTAEDDIATFIIAVVFTAVQYEILQNANWTCFTIIGTAEMEKDIMKKVLNITKSVSVKISQQTGVEPSLQANKDVI